MIWKKNFTLSDLNALCQGSAVGHLGIEFTAFDDNSLTATLTVDERTMQPFGLLHGGVSAALAETVGSGAAGLCCEEGYGIVGTELSISHLKGIKKGDKAIAKATPLHLGKRTHVWQIEIRDEQGQLCAMSRHTVAILEPR